MEDSKISMIVGLGNVGIRYAETRHNIGFDLLDKLSLDLKMRQVNGPGEFYIAEKEIENRILRLIWPTTFMNRSGVSVLQAMVNYGLTVDNILVAYDDYYLPLGNIRIRMGGSDGGHNGMESIINHLETENILRLRMGIGPLPEDTDSAQFVLNRFTPDEIEKRKKMLGKSAEAVLYLLKNCPEKAMSLYNYNPAPDESI
jgi:PTH1 family peptidyl-tRNA hydrolase